MDKMPKNDRESVKSPANSREGTIANCDGFPETMEPKAIFAENTPPDRVAMDSTMGIGSKLAKGQNKE